MAKRGIKPGQKWSETRRLANDRRRAKRAVSANSKPIVVTAQEALESK